jgi:hypothetical protein
MFDQERLRSMHADWGLRKVPVLYCRWDMRPVKYQDAWYVLVCRRYD